MNTTLGYPAGIDFLGSLKNSSAAVHKKFYHLVVSRLIVSTAMTTCDYAYGPQNKCVDEILEGAESAFQSIHGHFHNTARNEN